MLGLLWKNKSFILFSAAVLLLAAWSVLGYLWVGIGAEQAEAKMVTEAIATVNQSAPAMAESLRELKARTDPRAFLVAIRAGEDGSGFGSIATLAGRNAENKPLPEVVLARIASDPSLCPSEEEREEFLTAHGTALQLLSRVESPDPIRQYLELLVRSSQDSRLWDVARGDPMAMYVWQNVESEELREFYVEQRQWLAEVIVQLIQDDEPNESSEATKGTFTKALEIGKRYYPLTKDAVMESGRGTDDGTGNETAHAEPSGLGALGFSFFYQFGDAIERSVNGTKDYDGIPLAEVLDVLFANADVALEIQSEKGPKELADTLLRLRRSSLQRDQAANLVKSDEQSQTITAWEAARKLPLVLRLYRDAPQDAEIVIERFGTDDIATFLYSAYEDQITVATKAIATYDDLGIYILSLYSGEERFHAMLGKPRIGCHAVPYVAHFGDQGIDRIEDNPAWFDKYFDENGKEKKEGWVYSLPIVGAPSKILSNLANGYPNEWSELGWAALDTADGVILVATMGSYFVVKLPAKAAVKAAVRAEAKEIAQSSVKGARLQARRAIKSGPSHLKRFASAVKGRKIGELKGVYSAMKAVTSRQLSAVWRQFLSSTKTGLRSIKSTSPQLRNRILRGTLAAGLAITLTFRTVPALQSAFEPTMERLASLSETIAESIDKTVVQPFLTAIDTLRGVAETIYRQRFGIYIVGLLGLGTLCYFLRPRLGAVRHV